MFYRQLSENYNYHLFNYFRTIINILEDIIDKLKKIYRSRSIKKNFNHKKIKYDLRQIKKDLFL